MSGALFRLWVFNGYIISRGYRYNRRKGDKDKRSVKKRRKKWIGGGRMGFTLLCALVMTVGTLLNKLLK